MVVVVGGSDGLDDLLELNDGGVDPGRGVVVLGVAGSSDSLGDLVKLNDGGVVVVVVVVAGHNSGWHETEKFPDVRFFR